MKFEVFDEKGICMMNTAHSKYIPTISQITSMVKCGYKFKLNNKTISKSKLVEWLKQNEKERGNVNH